MLPSGVWYAVQNNLPSRGRHGPLLGRRIRQAEQRASQDRYLLLGKRTKTGCMHQTFVILHGTVNIGSTSPWLSSSHLRQYPGLTLPVHCPSGAQGERSHSQDMSLAALRDQIHKPVRRTQ